MLKLAIFTYIIFLPKFNNKNPNINIIKITLNTNRNILNTKFLYRKLNIYESQPHQLIPSSEDNTDVSPQYNS